MTVLDLLFLVAFVFNVALSVSVVGANWNRRVNQQYFLFSLTVAVWHGFGWMILHTQSAYQAAALIRSASVMAAVIPTTIRAIHLAIRHPENSFFRNLVGVRWMLGLNALVAILCSTDFFMRDVTFPLLPSGEIGLAEPVYGPGFAVYGIYFLLVAVGLVASLIRDLNKLKGIQRAEVGFVVFGAAAAMIIGTFLGIAVPIMTGTSKYVPICHSFAVVIMTSVIGYGIATRRVMEISQVVQHIISYVIVILYLSIVYTLMYYGTMGFGRAFGSASPWLAHILSTLVVALSMSSVSARIQPWVSRLIHGKSAAVRDRLIRDSGRLLMSVRSLDSVYKEFASIVSRVLDAEDVRIMVLQGSEFEEAFPADGTKAAFSESHPIVRRVIRISEPTPRYSVERESPTVERNELMEAMDQSDIHLFAPVFLPNGVGALVLMGARSTGFFYGGQEIDLIRNLCDQFGFALDNARLYTEVEDGKRYNETILESLSSGVIACDARRRITLLNREAARVMGVEPAEMVGRPAEAMPGGLTEMMDNALGGGNGAREAEITLPGEPVRYLRVSSSVFTGIEGRRLGALLVVTDVTALRRMEDTMRRADRLASVGTLAAGMAHEIKNPLVTIKTFVQVLPRAFDDPEVRETFCPLIESEVSRIDTVVNSLLNFARPAKAELAPIHLHEILVRTLRLVEPRLHSAGIEIKADLNAEDDRIEGDASLLEQVFVNLYFNAADAMKSGGRLSVETRNVRMETGERDLWGAPVRVDRLRVTVRDTGHGIPPEAIGHVFDPFFTTKPEGSGLGLAISHGIVEEHGGSFEVESTVGAGAAFHVSFPPIHGKDAAA